MPRKIRLRSCQFAPVNQRRPVGMAGPGCRKSVDFFHWGAYHLNGGSITEPLCALVSAKPGRGMNSRMTGRLLQPACRSWLTVLVCCVLTLLSAGEAASPFQLAVQDLLTESPCESEPGRDDDGETGTLPAPVQASRRSIHQRHGSPYGH